MIAWSSSLQVKKSNPAAKVFLQKYFYFFMSVLIAVVITYGFSRTMGKNLIHPAVPRPGLLYLHASIFFGWLVYCIVQTGLIRVRKVSIHRTLGWLGVALGAMIVVLGLSTTVIMGRFYLTTMHESLGFFDPGVPFFDILRFICTFIPAILMRKRLEFHRRLILCACASLSAAGWGRYPLPHYVFYLGVDLFIVMGILRDLIVSGRVHKVYAWALPAFLIGQALLVYCAVTRPPFYLHFIHFVLV